MSPPLTVLLQTTSSKHLVYLGLSEEGYLRGFLIIVIQFDQRMIVIIHTSFSRLPQCDLP